MSYSGERYPRREPPVKISRRLSWPLMSLPLLLFMLFPLIALVLVVEPSHLVANLGNPGVTQAIFLSLRTTFISLVLIVVSGTPLAYLLARYEFPLRSLVDTLIELPTVLPPAAAGVALLVTFGRMGLLGSTLQAWGIEIPFTTAAVVIAQVFIAAPLFVRSAATGFANIELELEQAAGLDGAGMWGIFRHVTLPLSRQALLGGAVLAWARALGEFGATIIFAGNFPGRTQTMPLAIYLGFEFDLEVALTLSVILLGVSFLVMFAVRGLLYREEPASKLEL
jgi:molybdate transport system permease protein